MAREWTNIDVLRMEKFLLLTRRYLAAGFKVAERAGWKDSVVEGVLGCLEKIPLSTGEKGLRVPMGMRYHVIDIYVDELEKIGALDAGSVAPLEELLRPVSVLSKESPTKMVRVKAKEALEDPRLSGEGKMDVDAKEDSEVDWDASDDE